LSGIAGIVSFQRKLSSELDKVKTMTERQTGRGGSVLKVKNADYGVFGCTTLIPCDDREREIPCSIRREGTEYTICFDGLLYNSDEIKQELGKRNIHSQDMEDAELVLHSYLRWGAGCLNRLNGVFAFSVWNAQDRELFLARDRFGIKPLYYTIKNGCLIFASEIKGVLAHPDVDAVIDKEGICEVLGLGPAQTPGFGAFCNIFEIMPAHFAVYNKHGFNQHRYWKLESLSFKESFEECLEETKRLTFNAVNSELEEKGRNLAFFLSGGVDSSAITALAAQKFGDGINTFSLCYSGNDDYFTPTEYQPASDDYYIEMVRESCRTNHHIITVNNDDLVKHLTDAVDCRDLPGMADVDSSLYFLCKEMGTSFKGALSGECADEVFGGYPWFHRREDFEADIFPWAKNIELRQKLVCPELLSGDDISGYIYSKYNNSIADTPVCNTDNPEEKRRREIAHLNLKWFMYTLGARSERIGMNCGLEIRMPFCDYKLVEYIWNVPWDYKTYGGREKGLLRTALDGILPDEVLWRKKSPFPKTHNPEYERMVKEIVYDILDDKNSRIHGLVNENYIRELMMQPSDYGKPWFGQLMAMPQLYAYIVQIEYWLKKYNIAIKV